MPVHRKNTLADRQAEMKKRYQKQNRQQDRRQKIDPDRVEALAGMGLSIPQIAQALHCSEESLRTRYQKPVQDGRMRHGIAVHKALWEKALKGDRKALAFFMLLLNGMVFDLHARAKREGAPNPAKRFPPLGRWESAGQKEARRWHKQRQEEKRAREYDEYLRRWLG